MRQRPFCTTNVQLYCRINAVTLKRILLGDSLMPSADELSGILDLPYNYGSRVNDAMQ